MNMLCVVGPGSPVWTAARQVVQRELVRAGSVAPVEASRALVEAMQAGGRLPGIQAGSQQGCSPDWPALACVAHWYAGLAEPQRQQVRVYAAAGLDPRGAVAAQVPCPTQVATDPLYTTHSHALYYAEPKPSTSNGAGDVALWLLSGASVLSLLFSVWTTFRHAAPRKP